MNPIPLPDGSRLVHGFRKDPKARYWQSPDIDSVLHALRACKSDYFAMNSLRKMSDGLGHPPDDETVLRRIAHDIRAGHLAWEFPAPPAPIQGDSGTTGTAQPQQKSESKPAPKSAPPPPKDAPPPPPKPATPAPSKPVTPPAKSGPSGTPPKPTPPVTPPKPPVVAPPVVAVSISMDFAGVKPPKVTQPQVPACPHDWKVDPDKNGMTPQETFATNQVKADNARLNPNTNDGDLRGPLFENHAIKDNIPKMGIKTTSIEYVCNLCKLRAEVDMLGADRLAEAKSKSLRGNRESIRNQADKLLSLQKALYPTSNAKPLVKLHQHHPDVGRSRAAWERKGFDVELIPVVIT
jgi:hypothetical protein